jgi:DNA recombination protein RmuC
LKENEQQLLEKFENLANKIFKEKTDEFSKQSKTNLQEILNPLKERIIEFQTKVETTNNDSVDRFATLRQQLSTLKDMNQQISQDAQNLTKALKGDTKTQGNWGEFILESILEKSGLVKGREYLVQESMDTEDGKKLQPDILVKLPDNKSIVVDSKVSLVAFEKYVNAENDNERDSALKDHLISLRSHIKNLSSKNYQNLYQLHSLDFVLLFMPIEGAFSLAMQSDRGLFDSGKEHNIFIVSPTTLLAVLRTIEFIWKREHQNKNALEIAKQAGMMYDKFVAFIGDLETIENKLDQAKNTIVDARKKLSEGSGNLIKRAEKIKTLGAKTSKSLPEGLIIDSDDELNILENE